MPVATVLKKSLGIKQKKIAIIISISIALITIVGIASYIILNQSRASASQEQPEGVEVLVSEDGKIEIFFQTANPTNPVIKYGKSPELTNEIAVGDFDTVNHSIEITGLDPNTTYYYVIEIGTQVYNNSGVPWTFTTRDTVVEIAPSPTILEASPSATLTASPSATLQPTLATNSATITITPVITRSLTPINTTTISPTSSGSCPAINECTQIIPLLGISCFTRDYLKCLESKGTTQSPEAPTSTPTSTPTPIPQTIKNSCSVDYVQNNNSCASWTWANSFEKNLTCASTFSKYFVQCKSTSFNSGSGGTWYCNETTTSNTLNLPCGNAPTPPAGGSIYCRVRAESIVGGNDHATDWVYGQSTCPLIAGDDPNCTIDYIQANNCTSWIWDFDYQKDPRCKDKFDRYYFQCTNDGNFNNTSRWYCNTTTKDHYLDLPCYNAPIPPDGGSIYCRVRAEDTFGELTHASSWRTSSQAICPTSTPTPTYTPTPTNTPTPLQVVIVTP